MYPFIEAEKAGKSSIKRACAVLKVSRAAYYEWRRRRPSRRTQEDQKLAEKVRVVFEGSRQTYGPPRSRNLGRPAEEGTPEIGLERM